MRAHAKKTSAPARRLLSHHEEHHPHPTFTPPYDKAIIYGIASAVIGLGVGIPITSVIFQNRKHGFTK